MLTPMDIQNRVFKKGFRGYSEDDVDEFMAELAREFEMLYRDNRELKETVEQLRDENERYKAVESTMTSTLMLAQQTAEEAKVNARKEAELIVARAEQEREQMVRDTAQYLRDGQARYDQLRHEVSVFRAQMESLLRSKLQLLEEMELPEHTAGHMPSPAVSLEAVTTEESVLVVEDSVVEKVTDTEDVSVTESPQVDISLDTSHVSEEESTTPERTYKSLWRS